MGNLQRVRQRFILATVILGTVNSALLLYLFLDGSSGPSPAILQTKYSNLKNEVARREKNNPETVRKDLKQFYAEDLPARFSQISEQIEKLTRDNGVTAPSIQYPLAPKDHNDKNGLPGVEEIKIETNVTGDYEKVARFINALEQDQMLFIIDRISLTSQQGGAVSLQISFDTFLRESTPSPTPTLSNKGI